MTMDTGAAADIEFFYDFASTYSYPAVMRVEPLAAAQGVRVHHRPFLLGPIFAEQGWSDSPFNLYPARGRYMWKDLARTCAALDLPFQKPTVFPRNSVLAAKLAIVGVDEGWVAPFSKAVFHANFAENRDIADPEVLDRILFDLGLDVASVRARAEGEGHESALRRQIEEAMSLEIFGSPTFVVGGELFWGNDRI